MEKGISGRDNATAQTQERVWLFKARGVVKMAEVGQNQGGGWRWGREVGSAGVGGGMGRKGRQL